MINNKLKKLSELGQSIWYDNIKRSLIQSGELSKLIAQGILGITTNPSIFKDAIAGSQDYDESLLNLLPRNPNAVTAYEELVLDDISAAAKLFLPVYEQTKGLDGYVSVEVNPCFRVRPYTRR